VDTVPDSTKNLTEIYDDIDLCYKVMGLTFSDPPDRVDRVYNGLIEEYNHNLHSGDQAVRKQAQENIEQTKDLYERITNSMIYKDYAREYEKYKLLKAEEMQARKQKQEAVKEELVNCPYCRKMISPKLKVCLYCHGKILTPMEILMKKIFTTKNMVAASIVVVLIVVGVVLALNPQLINYIR
jgi:hypothetical protein